MSIKANNIEKQQVDLKKFLPLVPFKPFYHPGPSEEKYLRMV
ncbi:MAG: hypothetical protein ACFFDH_06930 [Promethearchaeota archaeon]